MKRKQCPRLTSGGTPDSHPPDGIKQAPRGLNTAYEGGLNKSPTRQSRYGDGAALRIPAPRGPR